MFLNWTGTSYIPFNKVLMMYDMVDHWYFTRYITKSILCMPICIRGTVIGVVQMVNKQHGDGVFTKVILMVVVVVIMIRMIIVVISRKTRMPSALLPSTVVSPSTMQSSMTRSEGVNRNTRCQYDGDGDGDFGEMYVTNIRWHWKCSPTTMPPQLRR